MKKYTILTFTLVFGFLTASTGTINALVQDDSLKQRTPVSVAELPKEVTESIRDEFADYRITFAFKYSKTDAGDFEGTTQGTGMTERTRTERDKMREGMHDGAERMENKHDQMHDTLQGAERTGREGMHQGAERMENKQEQMCDTLQGAERTVREGMHEGAERMENKHDQMHDTLQGAERTGREAMQEGAERTKNRQEGLEQASERAGTSETTKQFLFTDEYDTYFEIQLEGPDMKTVWYTEDGERIENETESMQRR